MTQENGSGKEHEALLAAAGRAFRRTRFYGGLYDAEPAGAGGVPFVSTSDYHRASGLLDCVADREAMTGVLPPYFKDAGRFPFTVPEDEAELILRQARIVRALRDLGVDLGGAPRFLIAADASRGPFACEVSKGVYWEGCQASICYPQGAAELSRAVDELEPDYVILAAGRRHRGSVDRPRHALIVVESCGHPAVDDPDYPTLLYEDAVDLIGSRPPGRAWYDHDPGQLLIEADPRSGLSHVSKLQFSCFPLIRYGLGRRVPVGVAQVGGPA